MGDAARTHEGRIRGSVVDARGQWILGGTYAPDDLLPREDDLAAQLGVSRTPIREAVKVLLAKGLLLARRRVGVRVRDRDDWNLLDPQVFSWHPDVARDEVLITGLIKARRIIKPSAAALGAAQRDRGGSRRRHLLDDDRLLEIAARDLDGERAGLRSARRVWRRAERFGLTDDNERGVLPSDPSRVSLGAVDKTDRSPIRLPAVQE